MTVEPKDNGRKRDGTFAPGNRLGGRTPGARNKLGEAFIAALHDDFVEHGTKAIEECREKHPAQYLKVIASLMPRDHRLQFEDPYENLTDEQIKDRIRQLASQLGIIAGTDNDEERLAELRTINQRAIRLPSTQ